MTINGICHSRRHLSFTNQSCYLLFLNTCDDDSENFEGIDGGVVKEHQSHTARGLSHRGLSSVLLKKKYDSYTIKPLKTL
jgi:hypothetical protein